MNNELRALLERVTGNSHQDSLRAIGELRALLAAPAGPRATGLSQGWNLTRKQDGFVVGHQSAAFPPDEKAIERAERNGYVWVPFLVPAAQPQGGPLSELEVLRAAVKELEAMRDARVDAKLAQGEPVVWLDPQSGRKANTISDALKRYNESKGGAPAAAAAIYTVPLFRQAPAPEAVVLPPRKTDEEYYTRLGNCNSARLAADEFNSALDEVTRLNPGAKP